MTERRCDSDSNCVGRVRGSGQYAGREQNDAIRGRRCLYSPRGVVVGSCLNVEVHPDTTDE